MVWVCVSEDFDVFKITKIIYGSVTQESRHFEDLNMLQVALKEKLSQKKFLLVLDDVWNEKDEKWDLLRRPFQAGVIEKSKIIVTARNKGVASTMGSIQTYSLEVLGNDDCLSLFAQHALGAANFDGHPELKVIGENVVKKCKGLPLAVKTLGRLLRTKGSPKEWEYVLNSEIWDLPENKNAILPALRLSYHNLPSHLKHLFAYCSIFPKDYEFDKYELVLLWMAEGFLKQSKGKKPMEDLGEEYFNDLFSRSFFQHSSGGGAGYYVMHDLMNDLAQFVAGEICFRLDDKLVSKEQHMDFEKARHSSFIRRKYEVFKRFKVFKRARGLRSFLPLQIDKPDSKDVYYLTNKAVGELLPQLQCLRVLSLSGYSISELPDSINRMKHLRYIDLSKTLIKQVPETVSDLLNLQTLSLRNCSELSKLPTRIRDLVNLRHLDINDTDQLEEMPLGIGKLTSLRTLSKFVLGKRNGLEITELRNLSDLRGSLSIYDLQNVMNVQDARDANILFKQGLGELLMHWSEEFDGSRNERLEYEVLDLLRPHTNLRKLSIDGYGGTNFPIWVGHPSFSHIVNLILCTCMNCTSLPSLGQLPSLKKLAIANIKGVKSMGVEFMYGADSPHVVAFPSLETLVFENLEGWEEWSCNMSDVDENFPCLRELIIIRCSELIEVSLPRLPSLRQLHIEECWEVVLRRIVDLATITDLTIVNIQALSILHERVIQKLGALEELTIERCNDLRCLWQEEAACKNLVNLKYLEVCDCPDIVSLAEEEQVLAPNLEYLELHNCAKSLRYLKISGCPKLEFFPLTIDLPPKKKRMRMTMESFSQLEILKIMECSSLTSFPTGQNLPTTLKLLKVKDCMNLGPDFEKFWQLSNSSSSLEDITIDGWVNLKSLPGCLLSFIHLTQLLIENCPGIESFTERCLPPCLIVLKITDCENLKCLPDEQMQSLTSLESLGIWSCPSLESFPRGRWPPNLETLYITVASRHISEGGLQELPTSLYDFCILGDGLPELISFSDVGNLLPTSLTHLSIYDFVNLESLSTGLQHLTSLEVLYIEMCPKLQSLPETLLPTLSYLDIRDSPLLKQRCLKEKRGYWPMIDHIPRVEIDHVLIH